jgi:hypothetical protein
VDRLSLVESNDASGTLPSVAVGVVVRAWSRVPSEPHPPNREAVARNAALFNAGCMALVKHTVEVWSAAVFTQLAISATQGELDIGPTPTPREKGRFSIDQHLRSGAFGSRIGSGGLVYAAVSRVSGADLCDSNASSESVRKTRWKWWSVEPPEARLPVTWSAPARTNPTPLYSDARSSRVAGPAFSGMIEAGGLLSVKEAPWQPTLVRSHCFGQHGLG